MNLFILLYLVGFLRTILVIALIYFGIKVVTRYILPMLVDKGVKNMQQKMYEQQHGKGSKRPEGEVTIENKNKNQQSNSRNNGEYVDFEEVD